VTNLLQRALRRGERSITTIEDYLAAVDSMSFNGSTYGLTGLPGVTQTLSRQVAESIGVNFTDYATRVYGRNSVVFSCMMVRQLVFSAVRFQYQRFSAGRPSEFFGTPDLQLLEHPWDGGTTGDLLARMIADADLAGNSYWTVEAGELVRMRPDWVDIILEPRTVRGPKGEPQVLGYRKIGYLYYEGGHGSGLDPVPRAATDVAHFAPIPDPMATYRGMSWLTPLLREIGADDLMVTHKRRFLENGATPNLIVKHEPRVTPDQARAMKVALDAEYGGASNAYKPMHIGGGADITVVGSDLRQLDFKVVQGHGETRIAAAAGVPPIIVGLSEGLEAATYSNYGQARRRFADGTLHPLWQNAAGSLSRIIKAAGGARLWYDTRDVAFLREDSKDAAEIASTQATAIRTLVDGGYEPESVQRAVTSGDLSLLKHTGLLSVQLQPPGAQLNAESSTPPPVGGTA
jgi:phage portal protein BeeE